MNDENVKTAKAEATRFLAKVQEYEWRDTSMWYSHSAERARRKRG